MNYISSNSYEHIKTLDNLLNIMKKKIVIINKIKTNQDLKKNASFLFNYKCLKVIIINYNIAKIQLEYNRVKI